MQVTVDFHPEKTGDYSRPLTVHYDTGKVWALHGAQSLRPSEQRNRDLSKQKNVKCFADYFYNLLFQNLCMFRCLSEQVRGKG